MATESQRRSFMQTWLPKLLKMRTTKAEARLLVKRFEAVIAAMDAGDLLRPPRLSNLSIRPRANSFHRSVSMTP